MPVVVKPLTVREIKELSKDGLYIRVQANGKSKSFVYRYSIADRRRTYSLGVYPAISLADARAEATRLHSLVIKGLDPLKLRETQRAEQKLKQLSFELSTLKFSTVAEEFLDSKSSTWTQKDLSQNATRIRKYIYPHLGQLCINSIQPTDIANALDSISKTGCSRNLWEKNRALMRQIFNWAKANNKLTIENPVNPDILKHLIKYCPEYSNRHHAMLPVQEVPRFMNDLHKLDGITSKCLEFAILTAVRSENARKAEWNEINFETRTWSIPANKMKVRDNGDHIVPLSHQAIFLLHSIEKTRLYSKYIFPSPHNDKTLSDNALLKQVKDIHNKAINEGRAGYFDPKETEKRGKTAIATPHGIARASFRTWAQDDSLGNDSRFSDRIAELCLHHKIGDTYNGAYERNLAMKSRQEMMQAWADYCLSQLEEN